MKIYCLKNGTMGEAEIAELVRILILAGYAVQIGLDTKWYVEYSAKGVINDEQYNGKPAK